MPKRMRNSEHSRGLDILKREKLKREVMAVNQIQIQLQALEKLSETPMNCTELREFIEGKGGNYYLLLPILKKSGLLEIEVEDNNKQGRQFVYSLKRMV